MTIAGKNRSDTPLPIHERRATVASVARTTSSTAPGYHQDRPRRAALTDGASGAIGRAAHAAVTTYGRCIALRIGREPRSIMPIRVVLADDHPIVLQGLEQLFLRDADFDVVACCSNGAAALDAVLTKCPDVLVLDVKMPDFSGLDVLRTLAGQQIACRTVLLTAAIRDDEITEAVRLGALGLVLKESPPDAVLECVRHAARGEHWIEREAMTRAFRAAVERSGIPPVPTGQLTPREIEIVRMVGLGLRNKAIADRMSISEGTVKVHLHNIYEKLGVEGRLELVLCAQEKGIV